MELSYDLEAGALYIKLADRPVARTREVDESTLVDLDDAGEVRGIETTSLSRSLPLDAILASYTVPAGEEAQLRAYFQPLTPATAAPVRGAPAAPVRGAPAAPVLSAEPVPALPVCP
jgi:uncharacterized protein YuzE